MVSFIQADCVLPGSDALQAVAIFSQERVISIFLSDRNSRTYLQDHVVSWIRRPHLASQTSSPCVFKSFQPFYCVFYSTFRFFCLYSLLNSFFIFFHHCFLLSFFLQFLLYVLPPSSPLIFLCQFLYLVLVSLPSSFSLFTSSYSSLFVSAFFFILSSFRHVPLFLCSSFPSVHFPSRICFCQVTLISHSTSFDFLSSSPVSSTYHLPTPDKLSNWCSVVKSSTGRQSRFPPSTSQ